MSAVRHDSGEPAAITKEAFLDTIGPAMPLMLVFPTELTVLHKGYAEMRMAFQKEHLRAGGTMNGPAIMALADMALYAAVLSVVGMEPLAVTADMQIRFLRKANPGALIGKCSLLKVGKKFVVGEVGIYSEHEPDGELIAHVTGTYALPSKPSVPRT